ncbi:MAG: 3-keto-5-aminohexanoate cleavage protein [Thermoleophilia bacterium]|nr:3-keto-5-aminohexanoate cleavage protein [Thermoleophilia bacterium]
MSQKVIITAAITGSIHTPTMSPYLPITPEQIVENAVGACEAGAAVCHIHVRDPESGQPLANNELFREVCGEIKKRCNIVIGCTTGGAVGMSDQDRLQVVSALQPELASYNAGSNNFGVFPLLDKVKEFQYDWERPYIEQTYDNATRNTFKTLVTFGQTLAEYGVKGEMEVYEVGHIDHIRWLLDQGVLKKPVYIQFVLGILGGMPANVDNLVFLYNTAKHTIGEFTWSVAAAGRYQMPMGAIAMAMGGNVRVGLEDNLYLRRGVLAKNNAEQVTNVVHMVDVLDFEVATPDDAREILLLKGSDKVNF